MFDPRDVPSVYGIYWEPRAPAVAPIHGAGRQRDLSSQRAALSAHCSGTLPSQLPLCLESHACPQRPPPRLPGPTPAVPAGRRAPLQRRLSANRGTVGTTAPGLESRGRSLHQPRLRFNGGLEAGRGYAEGRGQLGGGAWGGAGRPAGLSRHLVAGPRVSARCLPSPSSDRSRLQQQQRAAERLSSSPQL